MSIVEPISAGEQVIKVLRKEDAVRIAPSDVQCQATNLRGNRCRKSLFYDEETDTWMRFCEKHNEQSLAARSGEAKKVKIFH
jgi:hypothetical protein